MRRVLALLIVAGVAFASPAAHAGECDSMDHYTYDHGECTDIEGDAMSAVEHAYDESYRQGVAIDERDRSGGSGGSSTHASRRPGFSTADMSRDVVGIASFVPMSPSPAVSWIGAHVARAKRSDTVREARVALAVYDVLGPPAGYYPKLVTSALVFATEAAYYAYADKRFTSASFRRLTILNLANAYARNPVALRYGNAEKERANDALAIFGVEFLGDRAAAIRHHDAKARALVRRQARQFIEALWHADPAVTPLDDFVCVDRLAALSCDSYRYLSSGGTSNPGNVFKLILGR